MRSWEWGRARARALGWACVFHCSGETGQTSAAADWEMQKTTKWRVTNSITNKGCKKILKNYFFVFVRYEHCVKTYKRRTRWQSKDGVGSARWSSSSLNYQIHVSGNIIVDLKWDWRCQTQKSLLQLLVSNCQCSIVYMRSLLKLGIGGIREY